MSADGATRSGPGLVAVLAAFGMMTLLSVAGGGGLAWLVHLKAEKDKAHAAADKGAEAAPPEAKVVIKALPTILTRLAGTNAPWLRLNLALVLPKSMPDQDRLAEQVAEDVLAFLRTIGPEAMVGNASFDLLRADLREILKLRTKGAAQDVFIRGLLLE